MTEVFQSHHFFDPCAAFEEGYLARLLAGSLRTCRSIKTGNRDSFNEVYDIVKTTNAITYTEQRADEEAQKAIDALSNLPDSEYKKALELLARFSVQRNY